MCPKITPTGSNVNYVSIRDIYGKLKGLKDIEGTIYRILTMSNKTYIARILGISRSGIYSKIRSMSMSLSELHEVFSVLNDFVGENKERKMLDREWKHKGYTIEEFNRMNRFKVRTKVKRRKIRDEKEDIDGDA